MKRIDDAVKGIRDLFPKENLLASFTISKRGNVRLFRVERMNEDLETSALLEDPEDEQAQSIKLKELRRYVG